ncbi:MAG: hypothetical protein R3C10_06175 [Pirellulales bacterium]
MASLVALAGYAVPSEATAAPVFLGPTPYLSAADSPFDLSSPGSTFHLEDFEDGELNTLGIHQLPPGALNATVMDPSPTTDSVDADDGTIDGSGTAGHSFAAGPAVSVFTDNARGPLPHLVLDHLL